MIGTIYGLFASDRPDECRYIGKTTTEIEKRLLGHLRSANSLHRSTYRDKWIRNVYARNATVVIRALETCEIVAKRDNVLSQRERAWIANGKRQGWTLTNATDGGEGTSGFKRTPEMNAKIGNANRGKVRSSEIRAQISARSKIQLSNPEQRRRISESLKGRTISPEVRARMSAGLKMRWSNPINRQKQSVAQKARRIRERESR